MQCSEICLRLGSVFDYESDIFLLLLLSTSELIVIYDVILLELSLKCTTLLSHVIKGVIARLFIEYIRNIYKLINMKIKLIEGPLTRFWYYGGLLKNLLKRLQILNIFEQWYIFCSRKTLKICRVTGIMSLLITSIINSKLGNPGYLNTKIVRCLGYIKILIYSVKRLIQSNLYFNTWRGQDDHQAGTFRPNTLQNWSAYTISNFTYRMKLLINFNHFISGTRGFKTSSSLPKGNKNPCLIKPSSHSFTDKKLTSAILAQLKKGLWLTPELKRRLNLFIEKSQYSLAESSKKTGMKSSQTRRLFELFIHSLLFQVQAIELLSKNPESKTPGIDAKILSNTFNSKFELLKLLKQFRSNKIMPLKRILIPKNNNLNEKRHLFIPSILDRATQALFLLVLDPIIEPHSDLFSFGFRKGRSNVMALATLQKALQSKGDSINRTVDTQYIWNANIRKCFDIINHNWLLTNVPIPSKYLFILNGWLKAGFIGFNETNVYPSTEGFPQGGIISPLLINFTLNGLENILEEAKLEFKNSTKHAYLNYREIDGFSLYVKSVSRTFKDRKFKNRSIACRIVRFADDLIIISDSARLLKLIKSKIEKFVEIRGLEIHPDKSKVIKFGVNTPFNFLGYTFNYLIRTNHIRIKFLHHRKHEWRLKGRARLFTYPSAEKFKSFKYALIDLFRNNLNTTAFELIAALNPKVTGWVNYFSFSNSAGTLSSLKKFLYNRIKVWMLKKHPKSSIIWLNNQYMMLDLIKQQHKLDSATYDALQIKILNHESAKTNKWNFYGLSFIDSQKITYNIPKLNILNWPTNIKKIVVLTVFAPARELLKTSVYDNKDQWMKESLKLAAIHTNKKYSLFDNLWKRDGGLCYLCQNLFNLDEDQSKIVVHHKEDWIFRKNNKIDNLALCHENCLVDWHNSNSKLTSELKSDLKSITPTIKFSKNRRELKTPKTK